MSALQRPELPPGPHRDLVDALHDLHHRAGWPSLRQLAAAAGCSHTTVSKAFSSPALPSWGTLDVLVEAMGGDVAALHELWIDATSPTPGETPRAALIAGRRTEVAAVRRHLERGNGLLLVVGEAGMGKSTVVENAAAGTDTFVATGRCLPLSTQVPLLPVVDVLREVYAVEEGAWLAQVLADTAPYVIDSLRLLLPELDRVPSDGSHSNGAAARQRLFTAVGTVWSGLASTRTFAVLLEDLHWADDATLDLVEHLAASGADLALAGTWRVDDPATSVEKLEWWTRVRRLATTLELPPLSRLETGEQLTLLSAVPPTPEQVNQIYRRTLGQPLFTEQLAAGLDEDHPLPRLLGDLLDQRLSGLGDHPRAVAVALAVVDRALSDSQLREVTGLASGALTEGLRELSGRRLLAGTGHDVQLRHPLLAEAVRRSMVLAESVEAHRVIASAMSGWAEASAAEVAVHWESADDDDRELEWRILAARQARARFSWAQEAEQWRRVIELWGDDVTTPVYSASLAEAYCSAAEAHDHAGEYVEAMLLIEEAAVRLRDCRGLDRARLLAFLGTRRGYADPAGGLPVMEEALMAYRDLPPTVGHVDLLLEVVASRHTQGRRRHQASELGEAVEVAARGGFVASHRTALTWQAWDQVIYDGDQDGWNLLEEALQLVPIGPDPLLVIEWSMMHADLLLKTGAPAEAVRAAADAGVRAAQEWGINSWLADRVRCSVVEAYLNEGRVPPEAEPIRCGSFPDVPDSHWSAQVRLRLQTLAGDLAAASATFEGIGDLSSMWSLHRGDVVYHASECLLWRREPERALGHLTAMLDETLPTELGLFHGGLLSRAARAAGDLGRRSDQKHLLDLRSSAHVDPFDPDRGVGDAYAHGLTWRAEVARFDESESTEHWAAAAADWDRLARSHDAAYCRWRAAGAALRAGHGTVAARLLKRAATDAREHLPLSRAIAATAAGAR